jgi:hypothetical protein
MAGKYSKTNNHSNLDNTDGPDGHDDEGDAYTKESSFLTERWSPGSVGTLHQFSDMDSSQLAQHHTLGPRHNQSSPGDHIHDGVSSSNLGAWHDANISWGCLTGAAPNMGPTGVLKARYQKLGVTVNVRVLFQPDINTVSFGGGGWLFSLNIPSARVPFGGILDGYIGIAQALSGGSSFPNASIGIVGHDIWDGASQFRIVSAGASQIWSATVPFTWVAATNSNGFEAQWTYEAVS